jgi:hypothetical protein
MLLSGVLFVLFLAACWLHCLIDAALTPAAAYRGLPKAAWIGIIAATFIVGALAWLVTRRYVRAKPWAWLDTADHAAADDADDTAIWAAADAAVARHPAGRSRKTTGTGSVFANGPDDDPDFLRELDRRIRDASADTGDDRLPRPPAPRAHRSPPDQMARPGGMASPRRRPGRPRSPFCPICTVLAPGGS